VQSADHAELRAFLRDNERALASYAKRLALGDDSLAREYYQQMCLKLVEANWNPGTAEAPLAYVKRVLLNGVRDRARREAVRPVVLVGDLGSLDHAAAAPHQPDPTGDRASERADAERSRARLVAALRQLSPERRIAVILYVVEDLSYSTIAEWTGRKIKTVRSDVARGLRDLRTILADEAAPGGGR
jgi:RNA polymerase sigma factor (sigma-70 family)